MSWVRSLVPWYRFFLSVDYEDRSVSVIEGCSWS
jgi:hypothetical protein